MKKSTEQILNELGDYLMKYPEIRFTQALTNLRINEFADKVNPEKCDHMLRDNYNDSDDKVLERILKSREKQ